VRDATAAGRPAQAGTLIYVGAPEQHPAVRSYKTRKGRMAPAQHEALTRLRPAFGVDVDGRPLDLPALFGRTAPVVLEIGSGTGEVTAALAAADPDRDVLAVEVHTPGVANLLRLAESEQLTNVRVAEGDAFVVLRDMLAPASLDEVRVLFPDPWPKSRHHKRRLVQPAFVELVASRLRPGGRLHVATDWPHYAEQVLDAVSASTLEGGPVARPDRPVTRFEQRALVEGRPVVDVVAVRRVG
jgi:tRNA (guanine-N7-)-methyltransferase